MTSTRSLRRDLVEIGAETAGVDGGGVAEHRGDRVGRDEAVAAQRRELADRGSVSGDDEGLTLIEAPHDLATVVAELSLRDRLHGVRRDGATAG